MAILLGIDIGTTSTVGILIDASGRTLATASRPADLASRHPGWAEEDPEQWWHNLCDLTPELLRKAGVAARDIAGIGVAGMVPTLILLDDAGRVLRPSIQQNDARAVDEIEQFQSRLDPQDVLARTGSAITQQSIGPKLLWLRRHEPEVMARARHVMGSYDYLVHRLTGEFQAERNWALESGLYDFRAGRWDARVLKLSCIDESWLGAVRWPREITGRVTPRAAQETGLAAGTPVVAGSADHVASAFCAGLLEPGDLLVKLGGAGDILFCVDQPLTDARLFLDHHLMDGRFLVNGCMAASGSLIKWFAQNFAPETDYATLDEEAAAVPAGSGGLIALPYFLGEKTPINDPLARGVLFGLTLGHGRAHVYRAIIEGISYGFLHHLAVLEENGLRARRVRVTNGGARSNLWKTVTADVLGLPLEEIAGHPGSCLGAAFAAGMGVGAFSDWREIERFVTVTGRIEPNSERHARYRELFQTYRELYLRNCDLFASLRRLG